MSKVPDYTSVVKTPIDLKLVRRKFEANKYTSKEDFKADILLIFSNAKLYNSKDTIYYKYAEQLEREISPALQRLKAMDE